MRISQFNARGPHNGVEHWFDLIHDELVGQGHEVRQFWIQGTQPKKEDVDWMDFALYHFAQVAMRYMRLPVPFCVLPSANDVFPDNGTTLKVVSMRKNCKFITHQSFYHLKKYKEWGIKHNFVYVPMPVRTELFKRNKKYDAKQKYVAGGRLIPKKGLHQLKDMKHIRIFGDGPLRSELENLIPDAEFVGNLNGEGLKELFNYSSVYLFPAVETPDGDSEGLSNTIKEAMLMKLPVVCSPIAGNVEFENVEFLEDWSKLRIEDLKPNWKGDREIRNMYNSKNCVNMLLKGIEEYG